MEKAELSSRFKTDFKVIRFLGHGADGKVDLCEHKLDKQQYAVKQKLFYPTKEKEAECCREAQILAQMNHANVLRYYSCWIENSPSYDDKQADSANKWTLFIVTEYCDSHLSLFLGNRLPQAKALNLFTQIVEGLKYIQGKMVVHRDLKPDNIFLKDDQVKIADFSLAKFLKSDASASYCTPDIGAEPYIPPEMKRGTVSMKSDIYPLGLLFYELLNDFARGEEWTTEIDKLRFKKEPSKFWEYERSDLTDLLMKMICDEEDRFDVEDLYLSIRHRLEPEN